MADPSRRPPALSVLLGPQAGREFTLRRLECTLGSDPGCDVSVPAPGVAAIHARLRLTAGGARLVPEPGAAGLFRNDDPVTGESPLASGDVVWLGAPGEPGSVMLQCRLPADLAAFVADLAAPAEVEPELHEEPEPLLEAVEPALEPEPELVVEPHPDDVEDHAEVAEPQAEPADEGEATIALSAPPPLLPPAEEEVVDFAATVTDVPVPDLAPAEQLDATLVDLAPVPEVAEEIVEEVPERFEVEAPPPAPVVVEEDLAPATDPQATMVLPRPEAPDEAEYAPTVSLKRQPVAPPGPPAGAPPAPLPTSAPPPAAPAAKPPAAAKPAAPAARPPAPATRPRPAAPAASHPAASRPAAASRRPAPPTARPAPAPVAEPPAAPGSKTGLFVGAGLVVAAAVGGFLWMNQAPAPPATMPAPPPTAPPTTMAALPPPTTAAPAPTVAEEIAEPAPTPAPLPTAPPVAAAKAAAKAAATPTPAAAKAAAGKAAAAKAPAATPAPAAPDPAQVRAQQLASLLDRGQSALEARQFDAASAAFREALALEPGNARATSGVSAADAGATEARRRFVPGRSFFLAKPSGKAPAGFNTQDVTVANPDYSAQVQFEATPPSVHAGVAWKVQVYALNDGKKAIKLESLSAFVTVNGSRAAVPAALRSRELAPGQRALLAEVTGDWRDGVKSWSLDVVATTTREETLKGSLSWK